MACFCCLMVSPQTLINAVLLSSGGSLTKLAYYSTVQHKVAKVRSFDHSAKVIAFYFFPQVSKILGHLISSYFSNSTSPALLDLLPA